MRGSIGPGTDRSDSALEVRLLHPTVPRATKLNLNTVFEIANMMPFKGDGA